MRFKKIAAKAVRAVTGEHGYRKLVGPRRPSHSDLLGRLADPRSVPDPFRSEGIPAGCIQQKPRDAIVPVYDPKFVSAENVPWLETDLVIGMAMDGEARAYPIGGLNKREMVLDVIGGVPVVVTWCPRCSTALVHRRIVDDRELILGNQGALCDEAMSWWDHDTGSIWSQPTGRAIAGPRKGATLELLPSVLTTWRAWRSGHPETLALDLRVRQGRHRLQNLSIGVTIRGETVSYPLPEVEKVGVVNDTVAATPIAVVACMPETQEWAVVSRRLDDRVVTLECREDRLFDAETGSEWLLEAGEVRDASGRALPKIAAFTVHPRMFQTIWQDGRTWADGAAAD